MMNQQRDKKIREIGTFTAAAVIAVLAVVVFTPYLDGPFIFDDVAGIRDNRALEKTISPWWYFTHPESASSAETTMIRPLLTWTYALNLRLTGPDAGPFRTTNLALHAINAFFIFLLTRRTRILEKAALPCAILFLVHPLAGVEIGYVSSRSTLLSSLFYLAAILVFTRGLERAGREGVKGPGLVLNALFLCLLYLLGLFSKSVASTLPAALILWTAAFGPGRGNKKVISFAGASVFALFVCFGIYMYYRSVFEAPSFFPDARPWKVWEYGAAQVRAFWTYARLIIYPVNLSLEHGAWTPVSLSGLVSLTFLASTAGILVILGACVYFIRVAPAVSFPVLFGMLYLVPTSTVIPLVVLVNENRVYLGVLALIWPLAYLVEISRGRWPRFVLIPLIAVFFTAISVNRGQVYDTELSVFKDAVKKAPLSDRAQVNYGSALLDYGRVEEAELAFKRAIDIDPCSARALNNMGNIEYKRGHWRLAGWYYNEAIGCDPRAINSMFNLGDLYNEVGMVEEAGRVYKMAVDTEPENPKALSRLGTWYASYGGDTEKAIEYLRKALKYNTDRAEEMEIMRILAILENRR